MCKDKDLRVGDKVMINARLIPQVLFNPFNFDLFSYFLSFSVVLLLFSEKF